MNWCGKVVIFQIFLLPMPIIRGLSVSATVFTGRQSKFVSSFKSAGPVERMLQLCAASFKKHVCTKLNKVDYSC